MRFDDDEYLKNFYERGIYPKIHDDIFSLDRFVVGTNVIDLGCCTGLLARRLVPTHGKIIGIECNENYLSKAVRHEKIKYVNLKIEANKLGELADLIQRNNIECIYARRVIPEIYETGGFELVSALAETLFNSCIRYLVIEGRKSNRNAVNPLFNLEKELTAMSKYYYVTERAGNCAVLKRR